MNTKTKSALRSTLEQESAALEARLPEPEVTLAAASVEAAPAAVVVEAPAVEAPAVAVEPVAAPAVKAAPRVAKAAPKAAPKAASKAAPKIAKAVVALDVAEPKAPVKAVKPAKAAKPAKAEKVEKVEKPAKAKAAKAAKSAKPVREKVVRDSFSMPKSEHAQLKALRETLAKAGRICTKSELLRAGVQLLLKESTASALTLVDALVAVPKGKSAK